MALTVEALQDYYRILQIDPQATVPVIDAAYLALRKANAGKVDASTVRKIKEAHDVLSDEEKKEAYDNERNDLAGRLLRDYQVQSIVAQTPLSRIYLAEQTLIGEPVCIKQNLKGDFFSEESLIEGSKAVWNLRYPSLPVLKEVLRLPSDNSLALVMSYIPGETVKDVVERTGKIADAERVCRIGDRILLALQYMHVIGNVIHGGVEPGNIVVESEDERRLASLVDFRLSVKDPSNNPGSRGIIPYFSAPEQFQDDGGASLRLVPQTDFYGLGKTMIYALTGDLKAVEKNELPDSVPGPLREFLYRLTEPAVSDRPPSWDKEDLVGTLRDVRQKSFGRKNSRG